MTLLILAVALPMFCMLRANACSQMAAQRATATATAMPTCGNRTGARRPPHIAFLMADDLGFADTGFAGSPLIRTPFLDTLAREAVHMTHFRAPTWCAPSRAAAAR